MYSLNKSRQIFETSNQWYKKNWSKLSKDRLNEFEDRLNRLDQALLKGDRDEADRIAVQLNSFNNEHVKKSFFTYLSEILVAVIFAFMIATVIREVLFEPYEIPTGSMRPTFREQDHLVVSKNIFGINVPLEASHFYFEPEVVQRTSGIVFTGKNMDIPDNDSTYFWIFPSVKKYVKRLMGKPEDTIYFYGGKIYGFDKDGNEIQELLDSPWIDKIEYLPFSTYEGRFQYGFAPNQELSQVTFKHMNIPIARILLNQNGSHGEVFNGETWVTDRPEMQNKKHDSIETFTDFWGFRNFGMGRLLTRDQVKAVTDLDSNTLEDAPLYLEIRHNPSLTYPSPRIFVGEYNRFLIQLTPEVSIIPLNDKQLDAIMDNMYTARFVVKDGFARRYSANSAYMGSSTPAFPGVPDGTYDIYYGKPVSVAWGGVTSTVPEDSPLKRRDPKNIQKLYNLGIEFSTLFEPTSRNQITYPSRYVYFRDGDLYTMGAPIIKKDDPTLQKFVKSEMKRQSDSTDQKPYSAFVDHGAPLKDGKIDKDFLKTFGLKIPSKHYLALGDNHAMSADSRFFGFVPEDNLQGSPSVLVWPAGDRWGEPSQKPYPWFTNSRVITWSITAAILAIWALISWLLKRRPHFRKLSK
jgi:signal peptidase I